MNDRFSTLDRATAGAEYEAIVVPDLCTDGTPCFLARHPELPGCMSHGATPEEALDNLQGARELYIRSLLEDGMTVPPPSARTNGGSATRRAG